MKRLKEQLIDSYTALLKGVDKHSADHSLLSAYIEELKKKNIKIPENDYIHIIECIALTLSTIESVKTNPYSKSLESLWDECADHLNNPKTKISFKK